MADMDQGIKRLIQTHPADVLSLAVPGAEYLGTLPVDVAAEPQLTLDTLLRVRYHGREYALDIEAEARPKPDIAQRLYEYGTRARLVTGLRVISVVLWLEPDGPPPMSPYEEWADDRPLSAWYFTGIEVYKLSAEELIEQRPWGLLPLVPFARGGDDFAIIEQAAVRLKEQVPADDVQELESLLAMFATRRFPDNLILSLMRRLFMSTEIIKDSALYQRAVREGIEQGKAEALRSAITVILRQRFGELPVDMTEALGRENAAALEAVLASAVTASIEQIRTQLGLQTP